jgi:hypothetical protein
MLRWFCGKRCSIIILVVNCNLAKEVLMGFTPLDIDRDKLTIMGVPFPNLERLERTIAPLVSIMYEGFEPTPRNIEILRDYMAGDITKLQLVEIYRKRINAV